MFENENYQKEVISEHYKKEKEYWLNQLSGDLVKTTFPADFHISAQDPEGVEETREHLKFSISPGLFLTISKLSNQSDFRMHIILTAILVVLLNRYSGEDDIIVGAPVLKQESEADFINSILVLRNRVESNRTFKELLRQVWQTMTAAIENVNYPLKMLLYQLKLPTISTRDTFPLFDVAILLENIHDRRYLDNIRLNIIFKFQENEDGLTGIVEYNPHLYLRTTVEKIISHYIQVMSRFCENNELSIGKIDMLTEEEKKDLGHFNSTSAAYPQEKTLHELFEKQAGIAPDSLAAVYEDQHISYRELNTKANQLARILQKKDVKPGTIVGLLLPRTQEMVIGILGVLKAGGAYLALDANTPRERILSMLEDCRCALCLSSSRVVEPHTLQEKKFTREFIRLDGLNEVLAGEAGENPDPVAKPKDLAYVIFTSGSSGHPKGVLVGHQALVNYVTWAANTYVKNEKINFPLYTAITFDLTVTSIFTPLITGNTIMIYGEEEKEFVIEKIIESSSIGAIKLTPSHLKMIRGKKIGNHSAIKRLIVGGEDFESALGRDIHDNFPGGIEIYNEYGPTEAAVGCMIYRFNRHGDQGESVPIGRPINNVQIYILARCLKAVPPGAAGEIHIGGDCLARGYLNAPGLSGEKFIKSPFAPGKTIYKTGDLARCLKNGNIEFLGRIDKQIKIRGYRVEPGEVEHRLRSHKKINDAVVVVKVDGTGDKYLAAYVVLSPGGKEKEPGVEVGELKEYLAQALPDYMIPGFITFLQKIPLTPNGKVDREKLPEVSYDLRITYTPPRNDRETTLVEIWSENLGIPTDKISIDANYFELGGHSLKATILLSGIHKELKVKLPMTEFFNNPTIRTLSEYIKELPQERYTHIKPIENKEYYPLSSGQRRLFFIHRLSPGSTAYNIPQIVGLEGALDFKRLGDTLNKVIARHESLRTSFGMVDGWPVQRIADKVVLALENYNLENRGTKWGESRDEDRIIGDFIRPFDLTKSPLIRAGIINIEEKKHVLMVDMHHIITDGISTNILYRDFMDLYAGKNLSPLRLYYKDFSEWENKIDQKKIIKEQEEYWLKELSGELPILDIPTDFSRPGKGNYKSGRCSFEIDKKETGALRQMALREGTTMHILLSAIFTVLLAKLSDQEDIIVGMTVTSRRHADLDHIIGLFLNMLAIRNYPQREKTFSEFLREVRRRTLEAYDNQDYPFENLVDKLGINVTRGANRTPLFNAAFGLQNMEATAIEIPGLKLVPYGFENSASKIDMLLVGAEDGEKLYLVFEYNSGLFKEKTMEQFSIFFKRIVTGVIENPGKKLNQIEILPGEEMNRILLEKKKDEEAIRIDFDIDI